jgi:recombination protein RecA
MDAKLKAQKLRAIRAAFKSIDKKTKKENSAYIIGEHTFPKIDSFHSGSLMLDLALGTGGIPLGRIMEVYGGESSGKTLTMLKAIGECQKAGGICAFIDMEQTFDPVWATKLGVNVDELIVSQPDSMEDAFDVTLGLINSAGVDFIVLDSVAALVPRKEIEEDMDKQNIALVARGMSKFLRVVGPICNKNQVTLAMINQIRDNVGVMYGDTTTTPGGKALKFYSSIRIEARKVGGSTVKEKIGSEDVPIGHMIRCTIKKNKCAPPFRKAEFMVYYDGRKVDTVKELAAVVISQGLIPKYDAKGNISPTGRRYMYDFEDEHLEAHKKDDVEDALRECPKIQQHFIEMLKSGDFSAEQNKQTELDSEMSEEEFERQLKEDTKELSESGAEEVEDSGEDWENM